MQVERLQENLRVGESLPLIANRRHVRFLWRSLGVHSVSILDRPYRSHRSDWVKVKCRLWREANKHRHKLFKNRA